MSEKKQARQKYRRPELAGHKKPPKKNIPERTPSVIVRRSWLLRYEPERRNWVITHDKQIKESYREYLKDMIDTADDQELENIENFCEWVESEVEEHFDIRCGKCDSLNTEHGVCTDCGGWTRAKDPDEKKAKSVTKEQVKDHLNTLEVEIFANHASYILGKNYEKIETLSHRPEDREKISDTLAEMTVNSPRKKIYLHEMGYFNKTVEAALQDIEQKLKDESDFMDSHEENDEISLFICEILGGNAEVCTEYHYYSDGKHRATINGEPMQVNAWTKRKDLREEIEGSFWFGFLPGNIEKLYLHFKPGDEVKVVGLKNELDGKIGKVINSQPDDIDVEIEGMSIGFPPGKLEKVKADTKKKNKEHKKNNGLSL